jgi:predicted N-acyltransferase
MAGQYASPTLSVVPGIDRVPAADWDRCAGTDNPFVSHAFLLALEESGSVGDRTGWRPSHAILRDGQGSLVGCAPLYLKGHSYGEYVFDHGWAEAYQRAGGRYYPKLQLAVPFTPVPGPRLLLATPGDDALRRVFAQGLVDLARETGVSSLHATFCAPTDIAAFRDAGLSIRTGFQFHWENRGYTDFEGFLGALNHGKRKAIRKERREVAASGVELVTLTGDAIEPAHWDAFFAFYISTSDRKWGHPYLTRAFVDRLHATMRTRDACGPSVSATVMAKEYGSSPVDAAAHQIEGEWLAMRSRSRSASTGKWCPSRKNEVVLVVSALTNCCHSGWPVSPSSPSR